MILMLTIAAARAEEAAEATGFSMSEMWTNAGGVARGVIICLGLMIAANLLIVIERLLAFRTATNQSRQLAAEIVPSLQKNDVAASLKIANDERFKASYLGGLLRAGLAELAERVDEHGVENAERLVEKAAGQEISKLKRWMPVLATIGSTAPFVGLFGTTFGVINAFAGMASAGAGLASISAGISEALITTAFGIAVAVVGVWCFNYFTSRIEKISEELASSEADFLAWAMKLVQARSDAAAAK